MKFLHNKKGFTLIELIVAMVVLAILGSSVAGLMKTGLSSYTRISDTMYTETEARTALSLITVQIRQHDATGAIEVDPVQSIIRLKDDPAYDDGTIIWFADGAVYSAEVGNVLDEPPDEEDDIAKEIALVRGLTLGFSLTEDGVAEYTVTVTYGAAGETKELSQKITQRSAIE